MIKKNSSEISKWIGFVLALVLIVIAVPFFQLVLGFTNPTANPPTADGKLKASGTNLSISSTRLVDVASPVSSNDAANKSYVDAQVGGGNSLVTLFGVTTNTPTTVGVYRIGGAVPTCLRGLIGTGACSGPVSAPVAAGTGTALCSTLDTASTTWSQLYAGFGPLNTMQLWYDNPLSTDRLSDAGAWPPEESTAPDEVVALSDSICSTVSFAIVDNTNYSQNAGQVMHSTGYISACTNDACNTCRVCIRD